MPSACATCTPNTPTLSRGRNPLLLQSAARRLILPAARQPQLRAANQGSGRIELTGLYRPGRTESVACLGLKRGLNVTAASAPPENVPLRLKSRGLIKCADMEMRFGRQALAFAGQRRPAVGTKSPPGPRRRVELGYLTFGNDVSSALECCEDGDGRTTMLPTTLAMAPRDPFRLTSGDEAYCSAQAAALKLIAHGTELNGSEICITRTVSLPSFAGLSRESLATT